MQVKKYNLWHGVLLALISSAPTVNAAYSESAQVGCSTPTPFSGCAPSDYYTSFYTEIVHNSNTPSSTNRVFTGTFYNTQGGNSPSFETSTVTLSNTPKPFVQSESVYDYHLTGGLAYGDYGAHSANGQMNYSFTVTGAANTTIPVNFVSEFLLSGYATVGAPELNTYVNGQSIVNLNIAANGSTQSFTEYVEYQGNSIASSFDFPNPEYAFHYHTSLGDTSGPLGAFTANPTLIYGSIEGEAYQYHGYITTTMDILLNNSGSATGEISISAATFTGITSDAGGIVVSRAYIDPYISISPAFLALNPDTAIVLDMGVGNAPVLVSSVPVPAAAWLFASGLFGLLGFRKNRQSV